MQSSNIDFSLNSGLENDLTYNSTRLIPNSNFPSSDHSKKNIENSCAPKPNQILKFDTSQIKYFVDKSKNLNVGGLKKSKIGKESLKMGTKNSVNGEMEKLTDKISEKLSEKYSSSKSSYSKQHSLDSKEESKFLDQSNLKENDFTKKKTSSINPFENLDLSSRSFFNTIKTNKTQNHRHSESMKAPIKTKNDVAFGKPEMIEKINMNSNKDIKSPEKEEKTQNLNDLKEVKKLQESNRLLNDYENIKDPTSFTPFQILNPMPSLSLPPNILKTPPGLISTNSSRSFTYQMSKKNYSMMSSESTHDSENVTNTLTSSNSGHLETVGNLTNRKSDLNSSGKLDSSIELSGQYKPSKSLYINNNQVNNFSPVEFQVMMSHQNQNLKNKFSSNLHKNKLNQSVNEVFMYNPLGYHNMYPVSNNLNKSVIMDNEIQELDEQEDDNNKEILSTFKSPFTNYDIANTSIGLPTVISNNVNFFKENPRHRTKTEAEEDSKLYEIQKDDIEENGRTTIMIKNIPNKYNIDLMLQTINKNYKDRYDFFYLPIDFRNRCNVGYAFINFIETKYIKLFYEEFNGKKWTKFNSEKICIIKYARIQGRNALITHFKSSSVMNQKDTKLRPLILPPKDKTNIQKIINQQRESITESNEN